MSWCRVCSTTVSRRTRPRRRSRAVRRRDRTDVVRRTFCHMSATGQTWCGSCSFLNMAHSVWPTRWNFEPRHIHFAWQCQIYTNCNIVVSASEFRFWISERPHAAPILSMPVFSEPRLILRARNIRHIFDALSIGSLPSLGRSYHTRTQQGTGASAAEMLEGTTISGGDVAIPFPFVSYRLTLLSLLSRNCSTHSLSACILKSEKQPNPRGVLMGYPSPVLRPWARPTTEVWHVASATLDLRLPSQPQDICALRLVPNYSAWWQRHVCKQHALGWAAASRTCDLSSRKPTPWPLHHTNHKHSPPLKSS